MENSQILKEIAVQLLGFGVVFLILRKFAWKNLLGMIDLRRQKIEDEFSSIERKKSYLDGLEKEYRAKLSQIEEAARVKIQEASNIGMTLAKDIQVKARVDSEKMIARAKAEIDQDLAKVKLSMRNEIVEISTLISEKVLKEKLTAQDHQKLVEDFLKELEKVS